MLAKYQGQDTSHLEETVCEDGEASLQTLNQASVDCKVDTYTNRIKGKVTSSYSLNTAGKYNLTWALYPNSISTEMLFS